MMEKLPFNHFYNSKGRRKVIQEQIPSAVFPLAFQDPEALDEIRECWI